MFLRGSATFSQPFWKVLPPMYSSRHSDRIAAERIKKEFFAEKCNGLQFEYDAVLKKVLYIRYYNDRGEPQLLNSSITHLLDEKTYEKLKAKLAAATPKEPSVEMTAKIFIEGNFKWHRMCIKTIWTPESRAYIGLVGYCNDIHGETLEKCSEFFVGDKTISAATYFNLVDIFDIVRLIDPDTCSILTIDDRGNISETAQKCYDIWNRNQHCKRCTAKKAIKRDRWMTKTETREGLIYSVLSRSCKYGDRNCILEIAFCIDNSFDKKHNKIGYYLDNTALENFYLDPLTKMYSRAYMENFISYLENSSAVAIADIDAFKKVNDTYGHLVGDVVMRHVASVIKSCVDADCTLIRYGGDEFLFAFENISETDFFEKIKEIQQTVACSSLKEYPQIQPTISIGGVYSVDLPFKKAVDLADKAMYKDKFKNKN